jgi:hypothetical protein
MMKNCSHGVAWSQPCLRCERVSVRAFLEWAAPKVERRAARLKELDRLILAEELEQERARIMQPRLGNKR